MGALTSTGGTERAGDIKFHAANAIPYGWLKANGAAVSRATYAALFGAIGTTYGAGDGATTFNLPDLRGEFLRGFDDGRGADSGRAFGSAQSDAMQGHFHGSVNPTATASGAYGNTGTTQRAYSTNEPDNGRVVGPSTDGVNGAPRTAAETRPRNAAMLACIKF